MQRRLRLGNSTRENWISEINITPFVDVLLILLVTFLITAPLLTYSISIDLPKGSSEQKPIVAETSMIVTIDVENTITIGEISMQFSELTSYLNTLPIQKRKQRVYLQLDAQLSHQFVIRIMLAFQNAGFQKIGLVFQEEPL